MHPNASLVRLSYSDPGYSDLSTLEFSCPATHLVSGPSSKQCRHGAWLPDDLVTCIAIPTTPVP